MQNWLRTPLTAGLYLVATPLGTARDITLRALDVLASADVLVAEDTRSLRRLMEIHGVPLEGRRLLSYHDHSRDAVLPRLAQFIVDGQSVAYASEAGTPLVADPGFELVRHLRAGGLPVTAAPGPSAAVTALSLSGLPTDRFLFEGFLPPASGKRKTALAALRDLPATLIFYESPNRVAAMLRDAAEVLGAQRQARLCRELTKKFEEILSGTLEELAQHCAMTRPRGEIVVLVDRPGSPTIKEEDITSLLQEALIGQTVRDAADTVSRQTGQPRRQVYQMALQLAREPEKDGKS